MNHRSVSSALQVALRLLAILVLAAGFVLALSRIPLGPARMQFYAGVFLVANLVSVILLVRRGVRRPGERSSMVILAVSVVALMVSNLAMGGINPAAASASLPRVMVYVVSQSLSGLLMGWGLLAFPRKPAKGWVASRAKLLDLLGSLFFMVSLLLLLGLNKGWIVALTSVTRHNAGLLVAGVRIAVVGGVLGFLICQRPTRLFGPLGWLLLNVLGLSLSRMIVAFAAVLVDPGKLTAFLGVGIMIPVSMWFAALHEGPLEPGEGRGGSGFLAQGVLLIPFFAASGFMITSQWRAFKGPPLPVLLFLLLVYILIAMLLLAFLEVYRVNGALESQVRHRTRALEESQAMLLRTERMNTIAVLGSGAVHDINNLHQAILVNAQLLDEARRDERPAPASIEKNLLAAAQRAAVLTGGLMSFTRPRPSPDEPLDLVPFVLDSGALLGVVLPSTVSLEVRVEADRLPVRVPQDQMEQILINLVINARDAVTSSGTIQITLSRSSEAMACLAVADDGAGMSPELQARIFEPLFTTKPEGVGTGLGLPSIKACLEAVGGWIEVESTEGLGSTFRVLVPLVPHPGAPTA